MDESTEHGAHNVGRKLILARDGFAEKELEIIWWAVDSSGIAYGHYSAKDTKGLVHTVGRSDFSEGDARWVTPMNTESTDHGDHNVGRKLIWNQGESSMDELTVTEWSDGKTEGWYKATGYNNHAFIIPLHDFTVGRVRWMRKHARDCDGKPCECGANPPPKLPVWQAFYKVRVQAKLDPAVDEEAWRALEDEILALIYPRPDAKGCSKCIVLREESVGPYWCVEHMRS